jgi:hypothetical protein
MQQQSIILLCEVADMRAVCRPAVKVHRAAFVYGTKVVVYVPVPVHTWRRAMGTKVRVLFYCTLNA